MRQAPRRALRAGAIVAVAASLVAARARVTPLTRTPPARVTATFVATSDWGTGHEVRVTVTNGSSAAVSTWQHRLRPAVRHHHQQLLGRRRHQQRHPLLAVKKSWAGPLAPGATLQLGLRRHRRRSRRRELHRQRRPAAAGTPPTTAARRPPAAAPTTAPPTTAADHDPAHHDPADHRPPPPDPGGKKVVGYFAEWGVYGRNYHVKNIVTSGSAAKLTHIILRVRQRHQRPVRDRRHATPTTTRPTRRRTSVDGVADTWDAGALRGSFNQLRKLKRMYPHLKVIWSFGGWTWSGGFTQAAANPTAFANSCYNLVEDPRWADVFDGIDIDWEYPNACGLSCDTSGPAAFKQRDAGAARRVRLAATWSPRRSPRTARNGGKIDAADYAGAAQYVNWYIR